jgi:hypothetical protein
MENVAHTLKDLERVVLTWPPSSRTEYAHLRDSMTESLNSMSSHLQMGDERASDDGDEDNECDLSHAFLSEENDASGSFDEMASDDRGEDDECDLSHESLSEENDVSISRCQAIIACTTEGKIEPAELVHIAEDGALANIYITKDTLSCADRKIAPRDNPCCLLRKLRYKGRGS